MSQENLSNSAGPNCLKRSFGMREAVTITAGSVIGVGLFTTGSNVVGNLGVEVIFATLLALLVSIYPALLYAEMGAALPYAGGTYQFASLGLGKAVGVLAGWNFIISLVPVTGGEALAFSYYFKTLCLAFGWQIPLSNVAVALIVTIGFIIANVFGVRLTGRLQNGLMFFFWGVAAIWFLTMIPNIELPNFVKSPEFIAKDKDFTFIGAVCMIWWCFAGFEACVAMGEEIRFPKINIPRAMFLAPFVVFCVNALFQWYLIGITPVEKLASLATAEAPYAEAMKAAGIFGFPLALLAAGIAFGGDFSTLNASISTTPRYLFTMARDGAMPKIFAKVSRRYQTVIWKLYKPVHCFSVRSSMRLNGEIRSQHAPHLKSCRKRYGLMISNRRNDHPVLLSPETEAFLYGSPYPLDGRVCLTQQPSQHVRGTRNAST
ncbi:APC family permease [Parasutterella sp.]|uniref:APC family permease n=1 Tax=Parasutterella sp. TaxID=2049037 RepID=UPI00399A3DC4